MAALPAEVRELFERRNFAHMRGGVVHVIEPERSGHTVLPFAH
ncbi:MAG: hypothetical protein WAQ33_01235 [Gaiellaceae bacterium]